MDAFEIRMALVGYLRKLNASQGSVKRAVDHLRVYSDCSGDLWKCVMQETKKGGLNQRINILYMLDDLLCGSGGDAAESTAYRSHIAAALADFIGIVVPLEPNGIINLQAAIAVLENWKLRHLFSLQELDGLLKQLIDRRIEYSNHNDDTDDTQSTQRLPDKEILRRFEEDRERHKRLKEEMWVLPISTLSRDDAMNYHTPSPGHSKHHNLHKTNLLTLTADNAPLNTEFDHAWEDTSDYNEDDVEEMLDDMNNLHSAQC
ncbi:hypothetical protein E3P92_00831 [Wallemia ichthyophaga]|uniref:CID domain-containing protein n=1 Tax=Wallemia ichthyophaga TaxID=245174 RepID=A0A4T0LI51_WALIC|nr:hypothetical protein E3P91_00567 [Wallemia ichthyophaga]TIA93766.1 hypothetical protein E3P97_00736 [Wallemia ichthyophaga]TIB02636.1 hypothetical protein E3P95_00785 [Wallemia ichthyophaga]TIB03597.1 hypothetical protein E3P94_00917 [Wallemia ichthyophaga]TIB06691.1 hypothetical protein E3P96_00141 [Wallemia ichthyophaga]